MNPFFTPYFARHRGVRLNCGFILIASLLMLNLMALLALPMARSFTLQELIAGNQREKTRAFESALAALNYAEFWLNQPGNATVGVACTTTGSTPVVCGLNYPLANPTTVASWTNAGVSYTPPYLSVSTTGGAGSYYGLPKFYIQYVGNSLNTGANMYLISAFGYGGNANAVAVMQSTFEFCPPYGC